MYLKWINGDGNDEKGKYNFKVFIFVEKLHCFLKISKEFFHFLVSKSDFNGQVFVVVVFVLTI